MRFVKVLCVLALVFAVSTVAYAETQSVKVSGDITLQAFARNNYDLQSDDIPSIGGAASNTGVESTDWATFLQSIAEIQIDADLTDNVSGVIRLVNQRVWGDGLVYSGDMPGGTRPPVTPFGQTFARVAGGVAPGAAASYEVMVDLAYIELKEFLYSPLTLKIGRQDLWFGKGFIIGNSLSNPGATLMAPEYTAITSFDAIRATLDYDPWTIDAVFAKVAENGVRADDDTNLWGVNVGYVFDSYNAEAEAYWWMKQQRYVGTTAVAAQNISVRNGNNSNDIQVFGGRGSFDPIEDWTIAVEAAYEFGNFIGANNQISSRKRSAWAIDAMIECRYWQDDFAWRPVIGAEYIFYSGEEDMGNTVAGTQGTFEGWDPMFRGKFDTAIREFQNVFYGTAMASSPSYTNQHQMLVRGTLEPTDSLTFEAVFGYFWLAEPWAQKSQTVRQNTQKDIGAEVDLRLTWDYTEDVSFDLLTGWFFPTGGHFAGNADDCATDIVGAVKLSF
ncbi:alginate export family protein [Candidatus Omnitrophota bacterium]